MCLESFLTKICKAVSFLKNWVIPSVQTHHCIISVLKHSSADPNLQKMLWMLVKQVFEEKPWSACIRKNVVQESHEPHFSFLVVFSCKAQLTGLHNKTLFHLHFPLISDICLLTRWNLYISNKARHKKLHIAVSICQLITDILLFFNWKFFKNWHLFMQKWAFSILNLHT